MTNMTNMKLCNKCKIIKGNGEFSNSQFLLNYSLCRVCVKNSKANYRQNNKEKTKEQDRKYYQDNKNRILKQVKKYCQENTAYISQNKKEYYQNNKVALVKQRAFYKKNRRKKDLFFKLRENSSSLVRRVLRANGGSKLGNSVLKYLPYTMQELKEHLDKQFESWMSWTNYGKYKISNWDDNNSSTWTWQIDHIIPQSKTPYMDMADNNFKKCWALDNLRPLNSKQNLIDGNRK